MPLRAPESVGFRPRWVTSVGKCEARRWVACDTHDTKRAPGRLLALGPRRLTRPGVPSRRRRAEVGQMRSFWPQRKVRFLPGPLRALGPREPWPSWVRSGPHSGRCRGLLGPGRPAAAASVCRSRDSCHGPPCRGGWCSQVPAAAGVRTAGHLCPSRPGKARASGLGAVRPGISCRGLWRVCP